MTDEEIIAKGYKPWRGGTTAAPADWDRDEIGVLYADGSEGDCEYRPISWARVNGDADVIGYRTKQPAKPQKITIPDGPAPDWAVKRWDELWESAGKPPHWDVGGHLIAMLEEPPAEDPLRECLIETFGAAAPEFVSAFRDALGKRGLTLVAK